MIRALVVLSVAGARFIGPPEPPLEAADCTVTATQVICDGTRAMLVATGGVV